MAERTLSEWVALTNDESGWLEFYKEFMGQPLSDKGRFKRALKSFGNRIMFEAIMAASTKSLQGDPLNYVIGIALAKANDEVIALTDDDKYKRNLEKNEHRVQLQNDELEEKIEKARRMIDGQ